VPKMDDKPQIIPTSVQHLKISTQCNAREILIGKQFCKALRLTPIKNNCKFHGLIITKLLMTLLDDILKGMRN